MNIFGVWLKTALQEREMKQKELAKIIGTTEASVSRYIHGDREPKGIKMQKIMDLFDVHMVFDRNDDPIITQPQTGKWIHVGTPKSQMFVCSVCEGIAYYPQPNNSKNPGGARIAYKFCPYCRSAVTYG